MKLRFVKVNPVENMTIFIMDEVNSAQHISVANKLMDYSNIHGEQVGFIENPRSLKGKSLNTLRLQMMGGEFCGNATRSLAALMVHHKLDSINESAEGFNVTLEVSGSEELLECLVRPTDVENIYYSQVSMPLPTRTSNTNILFEDKLIDLIRIDFPGISHFIVEASLISDKEEFFNTLKTKMSKEDFDAFGIMFYDSEDSFLEPLVYVKATDSKFWERSCGSGTSALGVALAIKNKMNTKEKVKQPGGDLEVKVDIVDGQIAKVYLDGKVEIVAEGNVFINDQLS